MLGKANHSEEIKMGTPMKPNQGLLIKLGSALIHYQEYVETDHHFDLKAAESIMTDPEVETWISEMNAKALLPVKRSAR